MIYREHLHRSVRRRRRQHTLHPYLSNGEFGHVLLDLGKLTHTYKREAPYTNTLGRIFVLIWFRILSSVSHFISRVHLPYVTGKAQQGQVRKSQPTEEDVCGPGAWLKVGQSVPTLWEPLSPLTGELQDLLAVTGLRGGLPKTSISLFKSAWKSHKKLVSSHSHSTDFRRSFPILIFMHTQHAKLLNDSKEGRV